MRKIRTSIIGCGKIADMCQAPALASLEESEFVAVCDQDETRARAMAKKYNTKAYSDVEQMLADPEVEATLICTPHPSHCELVRKSAKAGVHVLCEKPMALSLKEADLMVEAARKAGIKLSIILQRRFYPAAIRLRKAIDEGKLGKPILGDCVVKYWRSKEYYQSDPWRGRWDTEGGGVLLNQTVHYIDFLQWFMGPVDTLCGFFDNLSHPYIEVEDTAVAVIRFKSGGLGIIENSVSQNPGLFARVSVHGDNGASTSILEKFEGSAGVNDIWTIPEEEDSAKEWMQKEEGKEAFPEFHKLQIQEFLQSIQKDKDPLVTGEEARKSLEIIEAIYRSQKERRIIYFPLKT